MIKNILIVDDEKFIRKGLVSMLERSPLHLDTVHDVSNVDEALSYLAHTSVDLLFTDIHMNNKTGIDFLKILKNDGNYNIPYIVMISGYNDFDYAVNSLRYGADEYLLKPIDKDYLYDLVTKFNDDYTEKLNTKLNHVSVNQDQQLLIKDIKNIFLNTKPSKTLYTKIINRLNSYIDINHCCIYCLINPTGINIADKYSYTNNNLRLSIDNIDGFDYIITSSPLKALENNDYDVTTPIYIGRSSVFFDFNNILNLKDEALKYAKLSFINRTGFLCRNNYTIEQDRESYHKIFGNSILQLPIDSTPLVNSINNFFEPDYLNKISLDYYEMIINHLLNKLREIYIDEINASQDEYTMLRDLYRFKCINEYHTLLNLYICDLHKKLIKKTKNTKNHDKILVALEYIDSNYYKDLNLTYVSNYVSMNYSVFSQEFKNIIGMNFTEYLKRLRIEKSKDLLTTTKKSIGVITIELGFKNEKHFSKTFKEIMHIPPSQYRKLNS